jgi:centrosomal protein CEP76
LRFYRTISCVFNHKSFYGNIQADDRVTNTSFELETDMLWKPMDPAKIELLPPSQIPLCLSLTSCDYVQLEINTEKALKNKIIQFRHNNILSTTIWDDHLSYLLSQALVNYESERLCKKIQDLNSCRWCYIWK